ncbi:hypothetical protein D3C84_420300 [compost metagenome]
MAVVSVFEQPLRVITLARIHQQVRRLVERIEVAGLLVMTLPQRRRFSRAPGCLIQFGPAFDHVGGLRLAGEISHDFVAAPFVLPDVQQSITPSRIPRFRQAGALQQFGGLQALGENQPGLRICVGRATLQLTERGLRVVAGQPVDCLKARSLQLATQAFYRCAVAGLPCQFPQALALGRIGQVGGWQRLHPALCLLVMSHGNCPVDHGQSRLACRFRAWRGLQQLSQGLLVEALHVGVGQALPALGIQLFVRRQGGQLFDGAVPVAQLLGPIGPGQMQNALITLGRQLRQPVMGPGRATEFGQAQTVGLP